MRVRLEPPGVPPPPELEGLMPLPCDPRRADEKVVGAIRLLAGVQARALAWLLLILALAAVVPALAGDYIVLAIAAFVLLLALSGAVAVRVFQAFIWTAFLRKVRNAIWADPQALKELCRG